MSTQDQYRVTVTVDGRPLGVFDSRSGGESDTDITKKKTGEGPKVYSSKPDTGDVTVGRGYERERDHELARWLRTRCGKGKMVISEQPLDDEDQAWGVPTTWTGILKTVNTGDTDTDSSDPRELELVMVSKAVV
ncbi:hypothetical protein ABFU82_22575 [Nocardioides sp. WV_118_6]